jgi:integrase
VSAIRSHKARQAAERLADPYLWVDLGLVFTGKHGRYLDPDQFGTAFSQTCKRVLGEHWMPHETRHSFITLALDADMPVQDVAAVVGHAKVSTTLDIYNHTTTKAKARVTSVMAGVLGIDDEDDEVREARELKQGAEYRAKLAAMSPDERGA